MNIDVQPGVYVAAVSGGVDSIVLLDMLQKHPGVRLVVAHFDHGIRHDSHYDRQFVQKMAEQYGLPFVYDEAKLGPGASEEAARNARYAFLRRVQEASGARAIVTAHHHDDAVETAVMNVLRGTKRKGLTSLQSSHRLQRPLLHVSKEDIHRYAQDQGLVWREDSTNSDMAFMRNYIRHKVLPRLSPADRQQFAGLLKRMHEVNRELDEQLLHFLHVQERGGTISRKQFNSLPHAVAKEVMAAWLRSKGIRMFDERTIERLVVAGKTFHPGTVTDVSKGAKMRIKKTYLALETSDR